jgi:hypothetical protein
MTPLSPDNAVKVWLEEYKALNSDVQSRVVLQHGLMNYLLLVLSAVVLVLTSMLKEGLIDGHFNTLRYFLLVLPILFSFFVWRHANHDINIINKAAYLNNVVRPNLIAITGDSNILGFEQFLDSARRQRSKSVGALVWVGNEHNFHLFLSLIAVVIAVWAFFAGPGEFVWFSTPSEFMSFAVLDLLLFIDLALLPMTIILKLRVATAYASIVPKTGEIWS